MAVVPGIGTAAKLPVGADRPSALRAEIGELTACGDRPVAWFQGTVGPGDTPVVEQLIDKALATGVPVIGVVEHMGLDANAALLNGWGGVAQRLTRASGVVPTVLILDGPCLGGIALLAGLVDLVVMTERAELFVNRPEASLRMTGLDAFDGPAVGGPWVHLTMSGVADLAAVDVEDALEQVGTVLSYLPATSHEPPPTDAWSDDPSDRPSEVAARTVPGAPRASYDVRDVIGDLVDDGVFTELRPTYGASLVVGLARMAGIPIGVVANQPCQLAGALDIDSSIKGARFVRWCDAFGVPLVTLVDTPGFRPGRDQEWQGIVRHGAKLAFAYAEATVPRVSVVLRKAYGGAYIVMDCKAMGSDCCLAWPQSEVAVMGAQGAVEILHRRELQGLEEPEREQRQEQLQTAYREEHLSPRVATERGFIDKVIDPESTRQVVAQALTALTAKQPVLPQRRHENVPL